MIYGSDAIEEGMRAVMFPVAEVDVFAETEPGRRERIPGKKAIVNTESRRVLSVVSDRYRLLDNETALELARKCCITAFPHTVSADWREFSVEAPLTGGHCRIDLEHRGRILTYDWSFSRESQDLYRPFVRVTNSYNTSRVFSLHFGFVRWACDNGMLDWHSGIRIDVAHDTRDIEKAIEREVDKARFGRVAGKFRSLLEPLGETMVPWRRFRPIIRSVLEIRKPKGMPTDRRMAWQALEHAIDQASKTYVEEFGETAYALVNAITELATRPPVQVCGYCLLRRERHCPEHEEQDGNWGRPYRFIRRERHGLQRLAGIWLTEFSRSVSHPGFNLAAYLEKPSRDLLRSASQRGSGRSRRSRGARER